jgi:hypothetical protein
LRFNYSRTRGASKSFLDDFGGAIPLSALPFPSPFDARNGQLALDNFALQNSFLVDGAGTDSIQRQLNIVGAISVQFRSHHFKAGIDYRRLTPLLKPSQYSQFAGFLNIADEQNGAAFESGVATQTAEALLFRNISAFVQDSWFVSPRLTATYGLRWDADLVPSTTSGPQLPSITGFTSLSNLSGIGLAPAGTPPFRNTFGNIAPRLGVAYQLRQRPDWGTVLRAGAGVFYDLATSETVNLIAQTGYPFAANFFTLGGTFPFAPDVAAPPPITPPSPTQPQGLGAFVPNFKLPYTVQWNVAIEQGLGPQQSVSLSYVGASGQRLVAPTTIASPNASLALLLLATNAADSNYNSLQLQMQRRLVKSLQVLASYTWSHSIDTASAGSVGVGSNIAASDQGGNRGPSDFDIRHAFSAGLTYAIPSLTRFRALKEITNGWSLQSIIQAQTARPISILDGAIARLANGSSANVRPDVTPGIPLYLYGPQFPGGKAFNNTPGAVAGGCPDGSVSVGPFCPPPLDNNGNAIRQGDFPRNALRGFGFFQWDMGIHRDFAILESLKLQLRAELFNVLNHPNFAPPISDITAPNFGLSNQILAQYLAGGFGLGGGSFSSLYQSGGPRSIQLALKLTF